MRGKRLNTKGFFTKWKKCPKCNSKKFQRLGLNKIFFCDACGSHFIETNKGLQYVVAIKIEKSIQV